MPDPNPNLPQQQPLDRWGHLKKIFFIIVITPGVALIAFMIYFATPAGQKKQREAVTDLTHAQLDAFATVIKTFHTNLNRWPTNLAELQTNPSGVAYLKGRMDDIWRRPYLYTPPTSNAPGRIQTYGADGDPNGNKLDGDASITIQ